MDIFQLLFNGKTSRASVNFKFEPNPLEFLHGMSECSWTFWHPSKDLPGIGCQVWSHDPATSSAPF